MSNSSITGGTGAGGYPMTGGPGIFMASTDLLLSDCSVQGGQGGYVPYNLGCRGGDGGNGIDAGVTFNTHATAIGSSTISGGQPCGCICTSYPGAGVHNVSLMRVGPGVTLSYGYPPPFAVAEPPHLSMPLILPQGGFSTVQVTGASARSVLLGIDIWNGYTPVSGVLLPFVLTAGATLYAFAPPGPAASVQFPLAIPMVPGCCSSSCTRRR